MKKVSKRKNSKLLYYGIFLLVLAFTLFMLYALSLLSGIENKIRTFFMFDLIIVALFMYFLTRTFVYHSKKKHPVFLMFSLVYALTLFITSTYIHKTFKIIDKVSTSQTTYYSSLVTLKENKATDIHEISSGVIGYLSDESSIDGNVMAKEILKSEKIKNKRVEYEDYVSLINALLEKEVDYIFVPKNYTVMFSNNDDHFEDLADTTKIIYTKEKKVKNEVSAKDKVKDPFSILIMGVDSEEEQINGSVFNGDALMLLTFNPTTLNTTILSIPRDSYVPIACFTNNRKSKITHAAWYGADCMINTIENFLDVKIDYYVKINFKGVVKLIDTLGGVEVDVPYSFCEQDSMRRFGKHTIYVKEGKKTLNGEEALALSRNRKANSKKCSSEWTSGLRNDFVRGQNQQLVLRATLNKLKEINNLDTIYELLNTISNNMETNMTTNSILSLYNVAKDIIVKSNGEALDELLGMQRLYLNGEDDYIYDEKAGKKLYNYVLYDGSIKAVSNAMKINLNLMEPTYVKDFEFQIDEEYEEEIIGKKQTSTSDIVKLPNFVGMNLDEAKEKAQELGITVSIEYEEAEEEAGTVIQQSVLEGTDVSNISKLVLTVVE